MGIGKMTPTQVMPAGLAIGVKVLMRVARITGTTMLVVLLVRRIGMMLPPLPLPLPLPLRSRRPTHLCLLRAQDGTRLPIPLQQWELVNGIPVPIPLNLPPIPVDGNHKIPLI